MNVLWLTNIKIPKIDELEGNKNVTVSGGWLTGLAESMLGSPKIETLTVLFPVYDGKKHVGNNNKFFFEGINVEQRAFNNGNLDIQYFKDVFEKIILTKKPDVIHIHGTEFQLAYSLALACEKCGVLNQTIVSVQGLVGVYADHYFANLPDTVYRRKTLYERVKNKSIVDNRNNYIRRGKYEKKIIELVPNVMGRTRWDKGCVNIISPDSKYYFCNETLRQEFYSGQWEYDKCQKYSILLSQGAKPIKGLHMLIQAVNLLKERYPSISVTIGGNNLFRKKQLEHDTYAKYLIKLANDYDIKNQIHFAGFLNAEEMKEAMLNANVFVSPSSIENSPNSLGEAMLLGVPCISSNVGGVADLLEDKREGFLYPFNEYYMLAYYLSVIFDDCELATKQGLNAKKHASVTHDPEKNFIQLMKIYNELRENK